MSMVMLMCAFQQIDSERHGVAMQLQHHKRTDTSSVAGTVVTAGAAIGLQLGYAGVNMTAMQMHATNQMTSDILLAAWCSFGPNSQLANDCCKCMQMHEWMQVYFPWASYGGAPGSDWCHHRHDDDCSSRSPAQAHTPAGPRQGGSLPPPVQHQVCVATHACLPWQHSIGRWRVSSKQCIYLAVDCCDASLGDILPLKQAAVCAWPQCIAGAISTI